VGPPLRVAIDLRPLALEPLSGIGLLVSQLLEEVPRMGVSYVGISDRPVPAGRVPAHFPVHVAGPTGRRIRWEGAVLPRLLAGLDPRPDLFHATWNHGVPAGLPMPALLSLHDLIPWRLPREVPWPRPAWLHRALYRSAVRSSARRATAIATLSEASRRDIAARLPEAASKVVVIPCAVPREYQTDDGDPSRAAGVAANRRAFGHPYWLYVGGFDPRKGLFTLLAAMAAAFPGGGPTLVLAGGKNAHEAACEAMAAALGVRAIFPGYIPDADLPALFAGASLFVYPSRYEGFGIPPLLALASGTPCVTTDGGAIPEVVGDDALVVLAGDARALAEALGRAHRDPVPLGAMAARGRARAASFSLEALASRTLRAYELALGRREGSS
jgi:glycosyltransferase involved in cell wall biosynthesis